jgi:hypothetical protein
MGRAVGPVPNGSTLPEYILSTRTKNILRRDSHRMCNIRNIYVIDLKSNSKKHSFIYKKKLIRLILSYAVYKLKSLVFLTRVARGKDHLARRAFASRRTTGVHLHYNTKGSRTNTNYRCSSFFLPRNLLLLLQKKEILHWACYLALA